MAFTYTYRDAGGAVRVGTSDAPDRAALFSELGGRGVSPLSVEGGAAESARTPRRPARTVLLGFVAVAALVGIVSCVVWVDAGSPSGDGAGERPARAMAGSGPEARAPVPSPAEGETAEEADAEKVAAPAAKAAESASGSPSVGTGLPAAGAPAPVFERASDQVVALALQADDGHGVAPIPLGGDLEREFRESPRGEIAILDTDDERTRALKERVMAAREEIGRLLDGGQSFAQVMREHRRLAEENAQIRAEATLELKRILDSGDVEGAGDYRRRVNLALEQMGIRGLSIPVTDEERAERAAARRGRMLERRARQAAEAEAARRGGG